MAGFSFYQNHILSVDQFDSVAIEALFSVTDQLYQGRHALRMWRPLQGYLLSNLFFEASTRSRMSFSAGFHYLGGTVDNTVGVVFSSINKGETLADTIRVVQGYVDMIVLRHFDVGSADIAAQYSDVPVINAGDGVGEHPTQALLDLYTIYREKKTLSNITVTLVGDLRNGRTVHSLAKLLCLYPTIRLLFAAPDVLQLPTEVVEFVHNNGLSMEQTSDFNAAIAEADVIYMTRLQRERFQHESEYAKYERLFTLTAAVVTTQCRPDVIILHPLPRTDEIHPDVDGCPQAVYFRQTHHGLYVRMALFLMGLLKKEDYMARLAELLVCR